MQSKPSKWCLKKLNGNNFALTSGLRIISLAFQQHLSSNHSIKRSYIFSKSSFKKTSRVHFLSFHR
eukprot:UN27784